MKETIGLEHGAGGEKSWELFKKIRQFLKFKDNWKNIEDDGAVFSLAKNKNLVFTTDSFIVDPIFFSGGDIGKLAICGTINDLAVMGAEPLGISLAIVIEEGFSFEDLKRIIKSIEKISREAKVPVVTGDTKVINKGKLDKIEITTTGVGIAKKVIENKNLAPGDLIIASGTLGDHGAVILAQRFNYQIKFKSDSKSILKEIKAILPYLKAAKDPTRGGLAANIVEMAQKAKVKIILEEKKIPFKKGILALANLLGIDPLALPSEGRFIGVIERKNSQKVLKILRKFEKEAEIIGQVEKGRGVFLKTKIGGLKEISMPQGELIPRIC